MERFLQRVAPPAGLNDEEHQSWLADRGAKRAASIDETNAQQKRIRLGTDVELAAALAQSPTPMQTVPNPEPASLGEDPLSPNRDDDPPFPQPLRRPCARRGSNRGNDPLCPAAASIPSTHNRGNDPLFPTAAMIPFAQPLRRPLG